MTPKEKAKELINKFNLETGLMTIERKQCALIVVEEILDLQLGLSHDDDCHSIENFYIKVKEELLKI